MWRTLGIWIFLVAAGWGQETGQLESPPVIIPGGTDEEGREFFYHAQPAQGARLVLTASNGFFTKGTAKAVGVSELPKVGDEKLIAPNFAHLEWKASSGSLRWHLLIKQAGTAQFTLDLRGRGTGRVIATFAGQSKPVPRSGEVAFEVAPGEHLFTLRAEDGSNQKVGDLYRIDVTGQALEGAQLLRVRWRPAAVHGRYNTEQVKEPRLLVFTTRSATEQSSYSPITTPFGYFGGSFGADGRSLGGFNFSMWGKEAAEEHLHQMPHLLGVGSREGEFSGFGHEGSGVKPRGWEPMPDHPAVVVQALRLVPGEEYDRYIGYYFDHPTNAWKFYAAGNKWHDGKSVTRLNLGSFCEIPGPPHVERSGDLYREVRRRGWSHNGERWQPLEKYVVSNPSGEPVNKRWYTTSDGEYAMGCGGIRLYHLDQSAVEAPGEAVLPDFLTVPSVSQLFELPIQFGEITAVATAPDQASVNFEITHGERISDGVLYFGETDALTFAPRELHGTERNSALSQSVSERQWDEFVEFGSITQGMNHVSLTGLKPGTTYYGRLLVNRSDCRMWNLETFTFDTPASGMKSAAAPVFRMWTYRVNGENRTIEAQLLDRRDGKLVLKRKDDGQTGEIAIELFSATDRDFAAKALP